MVHTSLNLFDLVVLIVVGLSALLSFYRGFLREVMSLASWIGAAVITLYMFPQVSKMIEPQVKNAAVASGLASLGVFIVALIMLSIFSGIILKYVKPKGEIGFLDNLIGLTFGIARGVLLVAISYFIMTLVLPKDEYPDWVEHAITRPYVAQAAHFVAKLAPDYLHGIAANNHANDAEPLKAVKNLGAKTTTIHLPSINELQRKMQEENERRDVR